MAIKEFKTESKRLLDLMANSIYTNTDIFLREIISNASDAIDKRNFLSLQNENISKVDGVIELSVDKDAKTITISDNGIGMNKEDLENNLGTIAKAIDKAYQNQVPMILNRTSMKKMKWISSVSLVWVSILVSW